MKGLSTRTHIALGLSLMVGSLMLGASFLGFLPDREQAVREGRAAVTELSAAQTTDIIARDALDEMPAALEFLRDRNKMLQSAAVRRTDGKLVALVGEHGNWKPISDDASTDEQMQVALFAGDKRWGQLEMRWEPITTYIFGILPMSMVMLIVWMIGAGFTSFYFYLGRVLKELDPSQAVPTRVRTALDTLAEGLLVIDGKQNIALANQAFAQIFKVDSESLIGKQVSGLGWLRTDGTLLPAEQHPWTLALKTGQLQRAHTVALRDSKGQLRTFSANCSPVMSGGKKANGVLLSLDDITALEASKAALAQARDEAEAANSAKSDFLANMSHEIRTPMNAVLGFTELLRRGYCKSEDEAKRYLDTIHSSGKHLLALINDILDLSKVESGRLQVERIPCAVHETAREVVMVLGVQAREKQIKLELSAKTPIPSTILCDPARLRQVITNLVGNAIKFTSEGGVRVVLSLAGTQREPVMIIDVIDSGIGIPQDKVESVFEPFVQADTSTTRKFGGTGLGLAISRKFARALGGDIVASSVPGKGSTFKVTLPTGDLRGTPMVQPDQLLAIKQVEETGETVRWQFATGTRILVVDDGDENRELLALVLDEHGLMVDQAENGQVAVDLVARRPYDMILMDMQMPVMDGSTATRLLRKRGVKTPIIALTAHAMKGFEDEMIAAGCTGYLTKPVDLDALLSLLGKELGGTQEAIKVGPTPSVIPRAKSHSEPAAKAAAEVDPLAALGPSSLAPSAPTPAMNAPALRVAVSASGSPIAQDPVLMGMPGTSPRPTPLPRPVTASAPTGHGPIESRFAHNARLRGVVAKFGGRLAEQLGAMQAAFDQGDYNELASLAHWLKGSAGTVGFDQFTEPALALEHAAKAADIETCKASLQVLRDMQTRVVVPDVETADA